MTRQLTPTPSAQQFLQRLENTSWNRELNAASEFISRRRRQRKSKRQRRRQLVRYNDYLPEDAPDSLLSLGEQPNDEFSTSTNCLSPLQKWFVSLIESIGVEAWEEINAYNITSLAYLYKHHVSNADGTDEYFGTYGERTEEMKGNHNSLTTFWSTGEYTTNVVLLGMHGADLAEKTKLVPTLQQMYGLEAAEGFGLAGRIQAIIETLPGAFNNPVLTANAMAIQSLNPDGSTSQRDSIIMGDGVFNFLEWLNLSADGPDYILSHEFGHHLQYDLGVVVDNKGGKNGWSISEETRRYEMMADSLGSYFNAHSKGGRMDSNRLLEVHRAAFSLGDCEDTIGSHHGTPRQRECASNYGANLAIASRVDNGHIISPFDMRQMFDEKYEQMLDLDDDLCDVVVDASLLDEAIYGEIVGDSSASSGSVNFSNKPLETPSSWNTPETYNPEKNPSQPANELDEPPPRVQNGTYTKDEGWFGNTESQWVNGRTARSVGNNRSCNGWTSFIAVALLKMLLCMVIR